MRSIPKEHSPGVMGHRLLSLTGRLGNQAQLTNWRTVSKRAALNGKLCRVVHHCTLCVRDLDNDNYD